MSRQHIEDAARALAAQGERTRAAIGGVTDADAARIAWDDWTVKDLLGHVEASHRGLLRRMNGTVAPAVPGQTLADINEARRQERAAWSLAQMLDQIEDGRRALLDYMASLTDADAERSIPLTGGRSMPLWRIAWLTFAHEREHVADVARVLGRPVGGQVAALNVSKGGVPKLPIYQAEVGRLGLAGDRHRARMHGGPTAALCLYALETIQQLQAEGHPIYPGAIGENVTVAGLDWFAVKPGDRLRIGPTLVEVTRYTTPCVNIAPAFKGGDFSRVHHAKAPGEARVYASVVDGGVITVGDEVQHLPS